MKDIISGKRYPFSMDALYYGLDVHNESTYAAIINVNGEVQTKKRMNHKEIPDFLEPY